jgi:hypothetical protein
VRELFVPRLFQNKTRARLEQANKIIAEYQVLGLKMTDRGLFYQFVARGLLENTQSNYGKITALVRNGRDAGEIDWNAIEDLTRERIDWSSSADPADAINDAARLYAEDPWGAQRYRPEVWIEKDALVTVIADICHEYSVPYLAHRGNNSASCMYDAGKWFAAVADQGQTPIVLYLSDHDPNGLDMHRDTVKRLARYARQEIEVQRLGLTRQQVSRYRLPPNFAKEKDKRYPAYVRQHGTKCWELDALAPDVIVGLIRTALDDLIDRDKWDAAKRAEQRNKALLQRAAENWTKVEEFIGKSKRRVAH